MKQARGFCAIFCLCLALSAAIARAAATPATLSEITPTPAQQLLAKRLAKTFVQVHFSHPALDDRLSEKVFEQYLDGLDSQRLYFLASITVPSFYRDANAALLGAKNFRSTTRDVRELVQKLVAEDVDGLVLDLRNNGGGYLPEAIGVAGLFLDEGPIVQVRSAAGRLEILRDQQPGAAYSGPLAVLTNRTAARRISA